MTPLPVPPTRTSPIRELRRGAIALASLLCACSSPAASPAPRGPNEAAVDSAASPGSTDTAAPGTKEEVSPNGGEAPLGTSERRRAPDASDPTGAKVCGGFAGDTCSAEEYCAYEAGQHCGAADASATCQPRPQICTYDYRPVCGCDNQTYANACSAAAAGQGVLSTGECPPSPDEPVGEEG